MSDAKRAHPMTWRDAIAARVEKATPEPWIKQEVDGVTWSIESHAYSDEEPGICGRHSEAWPLSIDDARFIAHARQDIPRLLDAVRGLREAVSTHHDLDDDDLGRSCRSTCWVCRALAHVEALGEQE